MQHPEIAEAYAHDEIAALVADHTAAAMTALWQWPNGRELTLYRVSWALAGERSDGWTTVEPTVAPSAVHPPTTALWVSTWQGWQYRVFRLLQLPVVVEEFVAAAVEQLPSELLEDCRLEFIGIQLSSRRWELRPGSRHSEPLAKLPCGWVREACNPGWQAPPPVIVAAGLELDPEIPF